MNLSRLCSQCPRRSLVPSSCSFQYFPRRWNSSQSAPLYRKSRFQWIASLAFLSGASIIAYDQYQPFRHSIHAIVRCSRVAGAVILGAVDYKRTFAVTYDSEQEKEDAYSQCHSRSAHRVLKSLLANGGMPCYPAVDHTSNVLLGIFIKLGQTMASL